MYGGTYYGGASYGTSSALLNLPGTLARLYVSHYARTVLIVTHSISI